MNTPPAQRSTGILIALAFCMALQMTGFVMILPLFARRFESFGAGVEALSLSALAYALSSTIAAPFMGMLADRFGRRPVILLSLASYIFAFTGYLFVANGLVDHCAPRPGGDLHRGVSPCHYQYRRRCVLRESARAVDWYRQRRCIGWLDHRSLIGWRAL